MTKNPRRRANTIREYILAAMPGTQAQIMAKCGGSQAAVSRWVQHLRDCGEARIGAWETPHGQHSKAIYHAGAGGDVLPPVVSDTGMHRRPGGRPRKVQARPVGEHLMALFGR